MPLINDSYTFVHYKNIQMKEKKTFSNHLFIDFGPFKKRKILEGLIFTWLSAYLADYIMVSVPSGPNLIDIAFTYLQQVFLMSP